MQGGTTENVWVDTAVATKVWTLPKGPGVESCGQEPHGPPLGPG